MEKVPIEDVEHVPHPAGITGVRRPMSRALAATEVAIIHLVLEPGDAFSGGLHAHTDQEEVFVILEGTATFAVGRARQMISVSAGEAIRFPPGEFQHGYNDGEEEVVALAIGAPGAEHNWAETDVIVECRTCGEETVHGLAPIDDGSWQRRRIDLKVTCRRCDASFSTKDIRSG